MSAILLALLGPLAEPKRVEGQGIPPVVSLPPCKTAAQAVEVDVSTGLNIPAGQQDPRWQIIAAPPTQMGPFPAYSTNPISSWVNPTPPDHWINRDPGQADYDGNYTYRLQFNLNPALYSSLQIVGNYSADNSATIQLNGVTQTSCPGIVCFQGLHPLNITSGFVSGVNTLDIIVNNVADTSLYTGLLVEGKLQATCRACAWAPTGMVAWWSLDEISGTTVADRVGGFDGTAQPGNIGGPGPATSAAGPPTFPLPTGMVGTSLSFSGTERIEVPSNPALEPGAGDFTIDAWVIYAAAGTGQYLTIVKKANPPSPAYWQLLIRDVSAGSGKLTFDIWAAPYGNTLDVNITPNTWHHVAATLKRGSPDAVTLYVDGFAHSFSPLTLGPTVANTTSLLIGGDGASKGEIAVDEVELFNRALAQTEIQAIFDAGPAGKCKCVSPPSDMVAWWPFDETGGMVVHDIADGNNGAPKTGPVGSGGPAPGSGEVAGALNFNGTSDFVQVPNAPNLNFGTGSLSIDAWIKIPGSGAGFMPIVDKEIPGPTDAPYGYVFYVRDGHLGFAMSNDINATPHASIGAEDLAANLADNLWHHVAVTVQRNPASGTGGNLFMDGATIATATFSTTLFANLTADNTGDLILGSTNRLSRLPVSDFFNGWIDEVEIFNRALAQAEIRDIYRAGSAGKCKPTCVQPPSGMVAWYPLDEQPGATVVHDLWTNQLNGTPVPSPIGFPGPGSITGHVNTSFDGFSVSYVAVPNSSHLNFFQSGGTGEFSIDAWVKISSAICCGQGAIDPVADKTLVSGSSVTGYALYLYTVGQGTHLALTLDDGMPVTSPTLLDPTPLPANRNWHHVAVTVARPSPSSADVTLYVNGAPWSAATIPVGNTDNIADLWIGHSRVGSLVGTGDGAEYAIDEVEIFNGVLTSQDILDIYHADTAGKCRPSASRPAPPPVRHLPFR